MQIQKYLERINYKGNLDPTLDTLRSLHANHLYNIPFENLDIHRNKRLVLDEKHLFDKLFLENRGGYCYELNGMFYLLLLELGYKAKIISARVSNGKGGWGEEFDHLAIAVQLDDLWLADVGFGDSFILPLKVELDTVQENVNGHYKIIKHDNEFLKLMKSSPNEEFTDEFIFTLKERTWNDFTHMNNYHQTSPSSHFTQQRVCTIATEKGRVTLSANKLTITEDGIKNIIEVNGEPGFDEMLFRYFKIKTPEIK